jgi:hypothetical protein
MSELADASVKQVDARFRKAERGKFAATKTA